MPMYQDAPAAEFVYVLNDAGIAFAIAEDQEQVDKLVEAMPQVDVGAAKTALAGNHSMQQLILVAKKKS